MPMPTNPHVIEGEFTVIPPSNGPHQPDPERVRFIHLRFHFDHCKTPQNKFGISNCGGATLAYRRIHGEKLMEYSFTVCRLKDNFSRYAGRIIALTYLEDDNEHYAIKTEPGVPNSAYLEGRILDKIIHKLALKNPELNMTKVLW